MKEADWKVIALLAVLLGGGLVVILWITGAFAIPEPGATGGWIYEYQSLIAGVLALASAGMTIYYLRRQIEGARRQAADERRHRDDEFGRSNVLEGRQLITDMDAAIAPLLHGLRVLGQALATSDRLLALNTATYIEEAPLFGAACAALTGKTNGDISELLLRVRSDEAGRVKPVSVDEVERLFNRIEKERRASIEKMHRDFNRRFKARLGLSLPPLP